MDELTFLRDYCTKSQFKIHVSPSYIFIYTYIHITTLIRLPFFINHYVNNIIQNMKVTFLLNSI